MGVVSGVNHAHSHGLVHRDLKPANVLLANSANGYIPKVTDFGLAKVLQGEGADTGQTRSGIAMGTPSYMSPEQIQDARNVDQRADIFSLGCILYELLTRRRAFPGEQALPIYNAVCSGKYVDPKSILPNLPRRLEMAIGGALMVDRDMRIPDCDTLIRVFKGEQEWVLDEDSPRVNVPLAPTSESPSLALNAPIMTISDGVSQQPISRPDGMAVGLLQGGAGLEMDADPDTDLGLYMEPVTDSISDAIDPVTLLPETKEKSVSLRLVAVLVLLVLLFLSWLSMGIFYMGWMKTEPATPVTSAPAPTVPAPVMAVESSPTKPADPVVQEPAASKPEPAPAPRSPAPAPVVTTPEPTEATRPTEVAPTVPAVSTVKLLSIPPQREFR